MMTIILENQEGDVLAKTAAPGNEEYLCQDDPSFPLLFQFSTSSYDCFAATDMPELIRELKRLQSILNDELSIKCIDYVVELAGMCHSLPGSTLTFTPFEDVMES
ncbi:hypothetical protein SAMN05444166_2639 [Singulisphaera sp. GP187]|uniref:hypothetical protein n=1 Tax=Singulisphaera sp. GP187 TaxID=1882752 RepID=UPI000928F4A0|nr:hypothetical protein [Singulisphaera sp. GP187]SIO13526.1 hypothetical protein SAMN05444166_2639 [Singulisphaera sp. GP187]